MKFFREKKVLKFDDLEVEIYEINVRSLIKLANKEYKNNYELIADNSSLTVEDLENATIEAVKTIEEAFFELNAKHFDNGGGKTDKKKS